MLELLIGAPEDVNLFIIPRHHDADAAERRLNSFFLWCFDSSTVVVHTQWFDFQLQGHRKTFWYSRQGTVNEIYPHRVEWVDRPPPIPNRPHLPTLTRARNPEYSIVLVPKQKCKAASEDECKKQWEVEGWWWGRQVYSVQCTPGAHSQTSLRSSIPNLRERWSSCNKSLTTRFVTTIDVFCTVHTNYCKSRALSYHVGVCNWTYELLYSSCGAYHNSLYQIIVTTYIKLLSRSSRLSGVELSEVCRLKSLFLGFSRLHRALGT